MSKNKEEKYIITITGPIGLLQNKDVIKIFLTSHINNPKSILTAIDTYPGVYMHVRTSWFGLQGWRRIYVRSRIALRTYVTDEILAKLPSPLRIFFASPGFQKAIFPLLWLSHNACIWGRKCIYAFYGQPDYKALWGPHTEYMLGLHGLSSASPTVGIKEKLSIWFKKLGKNNATNAKAKGRGRTKPGENRPKRNPASP